MSRLLSFSTTVPRRAQGVLVGVVLALAGPLAGAQGLRTGTDPAAVERRQIDTDYRAERQSCDSFAGNAKDVCVEQAKARRDVARAELALKQEPGPVREQALARTRAEAQFRVASQRCEDMRGQARSLCDAEAKAERSRARADAQAVAGDAEDRAEAAQDKAEAQYRLELARCERLAGPARDGCVASARSRFGKD